MYELLNLTNTDHVTATALLIAFGFVLGWFLAKLNYHTGLGIRALVVFLPFGVLTTAFASLYFGPLTGIAGYGAIMGSSLVYMEEWGRGLVGPTREFSPGLYKIYLPWSRKAQFASYASFSEGKHVFLLGKADAVAGEVFIAKWYHLIYFHAVG